MFAKMRNAAWHLRNLFRGDYSKGEISFSQTAEDLLIAVALNQTANPPKPKEIRYLDIGANHPIHLSNTFHFYRKGGKGVFIEPNPALCNLAKSIRPNDTILNVGIADVEGTLPFYPFSPDVLSTFSASTRDEQINLGYTSLPEINITVTTLNQIISSYFPESSPHILSLDIEGFDLLLIESIDFNTFRPKVICVETWDCDSPILADS
jgi:FkbM family methyltransferase